MKHGERITAIGRERARMIAEFAAEGLTSREIAREIGISHGRVCRVAEKFEIYLGRSGQRRFGFFAKDRHARLIKKLAQEANISPSTMVERIVGVVVDDGESAARKRLGKLALPTNPRAKVVAHERA